MMSPTLPLDCLAIIGSLLSLSDLAAFIQVSPELHTLLRHELYRRNSRISETLEWAACVGRPGTFRRAMDAGIDIAAYPAFLRALASLDRAEFLGWLFKHNAGLQAVINDDPLGYGPPLFAAIHSASVETVRILIKNGADVNHRYGRTPLGEALGRVRDAPEILHELLARRANVNQIGDAGYSPLLVAVEEFSIPREVLCLFLRTGADVDAVAELDMSITPLHAACRRGNLVAVRELLAHGAQPNVPCEFGLTPLHFAAERGYAAIVRELLLFGADPDAEGSDGCRALCLAIQCRCWASTSLLLLLGASPHRVYNHESPLTLAIESGDVTLVNMVLEAGVDIAELEHHDVQTALGHKNLAILQAIWDMLSRRAFATPRDRVQCYIEAAGGDYDLMVMDYQGEDALCPLFDQRNYTVLHLAAFYGNERFVSQLLAQDNTPIDEGWLSPLQAAAWAGHVSIVTMLLQHGASATAKSTRSVSALMGAAIEGHVEVSRILVAAGAKVNSADASGDTALHYAAENGRVAVVKLLLELGADLHRQNRYGKSVVDRALGQPDVIEYFMAMPEVDLGAPDKDGRTLLFKVASDGLADTVEVLFAEPDSLQGSEGGMFGFDPTPRLVGNTVDPSGTLPAFAAVQSRDWETIWRLLVVQDDILKRMDAAGKTILTRVLEAGDEYLVQQLLMYAMKNRQEVAWECSFGEEVELGGLCGICTMYLPAYLPQAFRGAWIRWDAKYFLGCPRKLVCRIKAGIHSWDAVAAPSGPKNAPTHDQRKVSS